LNSLDDTGSSHPANKTESIDSSRLIESDVKALQRQAARGSALSLLNYALVMAINLVTTLILASKLGPEDFGLVGIAFSIQSLLLTIRDGGFANALVQKKSITDDHINSVFWLNLVVALVVIVILVLAARPLANFYERPILVPILWLMTITVAGHALGGVQDAQLRKHIQFGKIFWVDFGSISIASVVAIIALFSGAGVWSLVLRLILGPMLYAAFCWMVSPWRPKFIFSWSAIRSLWSFGSYLFFSALLGYGLTQLDNPVVAKLIGVQAAGTFFLARQLVIRTIMSIAQAIGRVMFPVFSAIQDNAETIRSGYLTGSRCLAMIIYAIVAGVISISPEVVPLILGDGWPSLVPVVQILSLQGLLICLNFPAIQILNARGKSKVVFGISAIRGVAVVTAFVVGCQWGLVGVAVCWMLVGFTMAPMVLWIATREVQLSVIQAVLNVGRPLLLAIVSAGLVRWLVSILLNQGFEVGYGFVVVEILSGLLVYGLGSVLLMGDTLRKIYRDLKA